MPYENMIEMLNKAKKGNYAVGAFNIFSWESFTAITEAAEEKKSPVIFNINPIHFDLIDVDYMIPAVKSMAEKSDIPFALNLDHGTTIDIIKRGLDLNFSSVMFDGSGLDYGNNVKNTRYTKELSETLKVSVEGELGTLAQSSDGFTDPAQALEFYEETGVDCLAVAIGNAHGFYKREPKLEFGLLEEISTNVDVPIALHGGSGISDDDFRKGIKLGLSKINIYTEMNQAASKTAVEFYKNNGKTPDLNDLMINVKAAIKNVVLEKIDVMGSAGKA